MKKALNLLLVLNTFNLFSQTPAKQESGNQANTAELVLDQVMATVYLSDKPDLGSNETEAYLQIITKQDIDRSAFDGKIHTLDEAVDKKILCCKADSLKMSLSDDEVDRKLEEVGLPPEHQLMLTEKWHYYDLNEFKEAVREMFVSNMSQGFEIESRLVIPQVEVQAYYDQNPVWLEAEYEIQTCFVPVDSIKERNRVQRKLEKIVQTGKGMKLAWEDSIVVKDSEISSENQFLTDLSINQVYLKPIEQGFVLFKMIMIRPRRLQPLVERKNEIVNILRNERYPQVVEAIRADLQAKSVIYYPQTY